VRELGPHRSGGANLRPFDPHDECQRLCALSLSGDLLEEQERWLDNHLRACAECRERLKEYEQLADSVMPDFAAEHHENRTERPSTTWSIEDAERRLFAALPPQSSPAIANSSAALRGSLWRVIRRSGIAAGLLICALALGFELGHRSAPNLVSIKPASSASAPIPSGNTRNEAKELPPEKNVESLEHEIASLQGQVHSLSSSISQLQEQRSLLENKLTIQSQVLDASVHDQNELKAQLAKAESDRQSIDTRLASAEADRSREIADASRLREQLKELNGTLQSRESDIAQDQELLTHDRDIRNLMTARELYITDVYDVAKTGATQKPFGRIFYTKGKSLIFYGYDLDQQRGVRDASTFQAWGRQGSDTQHDVSLGVMYLDDSTQKRWALKFNDAETLAKIDTVFVTVEPRGPSAKPTGKPLLFASLRIDPNHP
jgi:anti-sigma-K factor RskA